MKVIKPSKTLVKVVPFAGGFQRYKVKIRKGRAVMVKRRKKRKPSRQKIITDARKRKTTKRRQPSRKYQPYTLPSAALGPDRIISIELSDSGRSTMEFAAFAGSGFWEAVNNMLRTIHGQVYNWIKVKQLQYVPEDTGALRRSIMHSIRRNMEEIKHNSRIDIQLGTSIPYAAFVNEMTTMPVKGKKHVRHPPYVGGYTKGRAGTTLRDEKAMNQFYNYMLANSRKQALRLANAEISKLYRNFKDSLGLTHYSQMRRLFTVRSI